MDRKTAGGRQQTSAGNLTPRLTKPLDWTGLLCLPVQNGLTENLKPKFFWFRQFDKSKGGLYSRAGHIKSKS